MPGVLPGVLPLRGAQQDPPLPSPTLSHLSLGNTRFPSCAGVFIPKASGLPFCSTCCRILVHISPARPSVFPKAHSYRTQDAQNPEKTTRKQELFPQLPVSVCIVLTWPVDGLFTLTSSHKIKKAGQKIYGRLMERQVHVARLGAEPGHDRSWLHTWRENQREEKRRDSTGFGVA